MSPSEFSFGRVLDFVRMYEELSQFSVFFGQLSLNRDTFKFKNWNRKSPFEFQVSKFTISRTRVDRNLRLSNHFMLEISILTAKPIRHKNDINRPHIKCEIKKELLPRKSVNLKQKKTKENSKN